MSEFTNADKVSFVRSLLAEHNHFWDQQQDEMRRYKAAYMNNFYKDKNKSNQIQVETADGYAYIEGFIASLFSKSPAVEVGADSQGKGDKNLAKEIANRFLFSQRTQLELNSRMALIYPQSYIKMYPKDARNILDRVGIRALSPWEVIIDRDASSWNEQRFVGHIYFETVTNMNKKFGRKKWIPVKKEDYFNKHIVKGNGNEDISDLPNEFLYCKVVELYDFINDKLYFWTPNIRNQDRLLSEESIPLSLANGEPTAPVIPLYYSRVPDQPMDGISAMKRIYDQLYEKNILRSFWANAVRRDTRQFLVREGAIDDEALAKITAGIDGAMIPVDAENLAGLISVVPSIPISSNHSIYLNQIDQDLAKGSVMAPFTRGEASRSSATEVAALAQYTASEIGRLARERDGVIEQIAEMYVRIIGLISEDSEREVVLIEGKPTILAPSKLDGKFKFVAQDQASTPIAESIKRQQILQLAPILGQLGVEQWKIRDEVIRLFDLPRSFSETPEVQQEIGPRGEMPQGRPDGAPFNTQPPTPEEQIAQSLRGGRGRKMPLPGEMTSTDKGTY
jgi:hypothetical protein